LKKDLTNKQKCAVDLLIESLDKLKRNSILSAILLVFLGVVIFVNPFWNVPDNLMKVIGGAVFFSAIVSGIRLIWTWPV